MRKLFATTGTVANYDLATEVTSGENIPTGNYALYVDGAAGVDLELLKDGAVFIVKRREGQIPLAFGGDDAGKLRLKAFPAGSYTAKISGQADITFTVGTVTPPTPNEPILEEYIENGTHYVARTASGTYKASVTKV